MADILLDLQSVPAAPGAGKGIYWFDSSGLIPCFIDQNGAIIARSENAAVAAQGAGFASDTYLTNSDILIPSFNFLQKTTIRWTLSASKTGAGVATPIYTIRVGAGKATTDTARLALTGTAQTAIADIGSLDIMITCRAGGAATVFQGTAWWSHRGTAANTTTSGTGFASDSTGHVEGTGAAWDASTSAGQFIGLSINGGTSASWTVTQCIAQVKW